MDIASPTGRVSTWLSRFSDALEKSDVEAALALFDDECYWRDLVSFTWNITTAEGQRTPFARCCEATLPDVKPSNWADRGRRPRAAGGVTEALVHASRPPSRAAAATCG